MGNSILILLISKEICIIKVLLRPVKTMRSRKVTYFREKSRKLTLSKLSRDKWVGKEV